MIHHYAYRGTWVCQMDATTQVVREAIRNVMRYQPPESFLCASTDTLCSTCYDRVFEPIPSWPPIWLGW